MKSYDSKTSVKEQYADKLSVVTVEAIEQRIQEIKSLEEEAGEREYRYGYSPDRVRMAQLFDERFKLERVLKVLAEYSLKEIQEELDSRDPIKEKLGRNGLSRYSFYELAHAEKVLQHQDKELQARVDLGEKAIELWEKEIKKLSWEETEAVYGLIRNKEIPLEDLEEKIRKSLIANNPELQEQLVTVGGRRCLKVSEWHDGVDSYVLGNAVDAGEFYYAEVNGSIHNSFEYDFKPAKETVEDDWVNLEAARAIDRMEAEAEGFDAERELYKGNPEFYKMFYAGEQNEEAQAFQQETGWHMIWGSDYQGFNGDTLVVFRNVDDLPGWMRSFAKEAADISGRADDLNRAVAQEVKNMDYKKVLAEFGLDGRDETFRYQMLSRMEADCKYYLGNGGRHPKHLWADNEKDQIACMKALWHSFPEEGKPEWLTLEQIQDYEKQLVGMEVLFTFGSWEKFPFQMGYVSITAPSVKMAIEEFRRNYPDVNENTLNCSDYYYTPESVAQIKEHGNGAGCHRATVVTSMDRSVDELIADGRSRAVDNKSNGKENDLEIL